MSLRDEFAELLAPTVYAASWLAGDVAVLADTPERRREITAAWAAEFGADDVRFFDDWLAAEAYAEPERGR